MTADNRTEESVREELVHEDPEKLVDVLARLEAERRRPENENRRRFRRFVIRGEARLEPLNNSSLGDSQVVLLRDVGYAGVGFLTDRELDLETMWRMRFHHPNHGTVFGAQPVIVRYCRPIQPNLYMVGAEFVIEPYLLSLLGVEDKKLRQEVAGTEEEEADNAEYRAPDALA